MAKFTDRYRMVTPEIGCSECDTDRWFDVATGEVLDLETARGRWLAAEYASRGEGGVSSGVVREYEVKGAQYGGRRKLAKARKRQQSRSDSVRKGD